MPRKLCWIEVDEEGKAVIPVLRSAAVERVRVAADSSQVAAGLAAVDEVLAELPDATEEVVEAVADALAMAALTNTEIEPYNATAEARDILRCLAAASPTPEAP